MAKRVIKYYQGPTYTEVEWSTRNPILLAGEIGYVHNGSITRKCKVGPGRWNDLPWFADTIFDRNETVTNPIGDAKGNLNDLSLMEIVEKMLFPYGVPTITNLQNNAEGGSPRSTAVLEIGSALSGTVNLLYSITNPANLQGATPINVNSGGIFSNDGGFANSGVLAMTLAATLNPSVPTVYPIAVTPIHQQGTGGTVSTYITYVPRIIWGVSPLTSLTGPQFNSIGQKLTALTSNFERDYSFTAAGYCYLGIPSMLDPSGLIFTDVTDPNAPAGFSMESLGTLNVNNGVGTYNYQIFRSSYYITQPLSILRVRN